MTPDRLKKYLAYYRKLLSEDPENIEARLRLAALFREMGQIAYAVDEYTAASKLLAKQGLALEAIAACKAVLELDPTQTEIQYFLARLFAQAPEATSAARVARPLRPGVSPIPPEELHEVTQIARRPIEPQAELLNTAEMDAFSRSGSAPVALTRPKHLEIRRTPDPEALSWDGDAPTTVSHTAAAGVPPQPDALSWDGDAPTTLHQRAPVPAAATDEDSEGDVETSVFTGGQDFSWSLPDTRVASSVAETLMPKLRDDTTIARDVNAEIEARKDRLDLDDIFGDASSVPATGRRTPERHAHDTPRLPELDRATSLRTTFEIEPERQAELERSSMGRQPGVRRDAATDPQHSALLGDLGDIHMGELLAELSEVSLRETRELDDEEINNMSQLTARRDAAIEETFRVSVPRADVDVDDVDVARVSALLDELSDPEELDLRDPTGVHDAVLKIRREELPRIPLLSRLSPEIFVRLLQVLEVREAAAGETILDWRDATRNLFIIVNGEVEARKRVRDREIVLGRMVQGQFFGEFGVLTGRDRGAIVQAVTPVKLLVLDERVLHALADRDPQIWDALWQAYHARLLNNTMASHPLFRVLRGEERDAFVETFVVQEFPAHQLLTEPDEKCPVLGFVVEGELGIEDAEFGRDRIGEGEFFGIVAALSDAPGLARLKARRDTTVLLLPGKQWRMAVREYRELASTLRTLLRHSTERHHLLWAELDLFLGG